ncbi:MacB family efflux pump subunit [Bartonella quintana]|uniref:Macrolide export ATP-binding/permease protein MacB n=3 Tax=Bartonella quintana TaxID=803 RepID=MACB_BARQU|nr:MacB family efflux pump subunit [Bartonella quintana]Q6FYL0.1 RecName: Full=Macrolide export ATP-binding/permease protein MacB [Bartonella quintana str. Toulouse]ETS12819.1 macrolide export ATP-binding/permease MacB [Bartonella quintana BQ2-D70]ETS14759.1 macrolide export ATP-binding/permease MacB [Bartonella quintana JK 73rel]ETS17192.1 macrolide export ATP-binding/permease MacB [Bartonella quintana JK 73]ETS17286.1 macrolide export ATP-binding/permease MacB [Bartonella quintana JK 12]ETS
MRTEQADDVLVLENIVRKFSAGETFVTVLKDINLTIKRGEMVAIVGASGSGKSTLMNILGCLDRPSSGRYWISGKKTACLSADELSALRRNHFGFIFQRYHLLSELTALGNVEIPAIYAGCSPQIRKKRAQDLLIRLGMGDRINHRPNQLSGGQQQRVSIARALMNNAEVILADEPTGALDKKSGQEVLRILDELHQEGRTIVIVTHDMQVAERAERIIEISDGEIIADNVAKVAKTKAKGQALQGKQNPKNQKTLGFFRSFAERFREAFVMALLAMNAHRMRTFLTMLGVIIGIAAIIAMVALGTGTREKILENFKSLGSNTLTILPGKSLSDPQSDKITSLVEADAEALSRLPYVSGVTPQVSASSTVRFGAVEVDAVIVGVGEQFFQTQGLNAVQGRLFDQKSVRDRAVDLVIEKEALSVLFPHSRESPVGKVVQVGQVPARIVGVIDQQHNGGMSNTLQVYLPYTTVQTRFVGTTQVRAITVKIADDIDSHLAESMVRRFLIMRHGEEDFFIRNSQLFRDRIMESTHILTLLVSSIAAISLIVGGIGVMNIMLVTVSERINEIGVRMAVGARQSDILQQFLIEAILVCIIGGGVGILFGLSIGGLFVLFEAPIHLIYTIDSIIISLTFSTLIGICFGFSPARQASRLDPVVALSRD